MGEWASYRKGIERSVYSPVSVETHQCILDLTYYMTVKKKLGGTEFQLNIYGLIGPGIKQSKQEEWLNLNAQEGQ